LAPEAADQEDSEGMTPFQHLCNSEFTFVEDRSFSSLMIWWYHCMPPQTNTQDDTVARLEDLLRRLTINERRIVKCKSAKKKASKKRKHPYGWIFQKAGKKIKRS